jgi:OmpA-OmpF porin, OOP family
MSFNLLDLVKNQFSTDLVSKAASFLGENESGVAKAISGILPTVLGGLVSKGSSGSNGATEILNLAQQTHSGGLFSNLSGLLGGSGDLLSKGAGLLKSLLGDKAAGIIDAIAGFAGIKSSSASSLMSMAAPAALSTIGKHSIDHNLSAGSLMTLLGNQKSAILGALPSGLASVGSLLGLGKMGDTISSAGDKIRKSAGTVNRYAEDKATTGRKWILPVLGMIAAGLLAWWFLLGGKSGCNTAETPVVSVPVDTVDTTVITGTDLITISTGKVDSITGDYLYEPGKMIIIDLPNNGGKLEVGENSTEAKLVSFLTDANAAIDTAKGNWFEFTNVKFKTGSSEVTDASMAQLKNMVAIAKSFSSAKFKFGGYTDNTGDSIKNVVLSQKRADAVVGLLKKLGAGNSSIEGAKGYGPQWPIGDNATAEGRAMNRRVAANVKAK